MRNAGYVVLTIRFDRQDGQWAAECEQLGTAACGDTFEEAQEAIVDLISLHLNAPEDVGEAEEFFKRHGVPFHTKKPKDIARIPVRDGQVVERYVRPVAQLS
jgi:predicted RNase H-like HicB family nuclease